MRNIMHTLITDKPESYNNATISLSKRAVKREIKRIKMEVKVYSLVVHPTMAKRLVFTDESTGRMKQHPALTSAPHPLLGRAKQTLG